MYIHNSTVYHLYQIAQNKKYFILLRFDYILCSVLKKSTLRPTLVTETYNIIMHSITYLFRPIPKFAKNHFYTRVTTLEYDYFTKNPYIMYKIINFLFSKKMFKCISSLTAHAIVMKNQSYKSTNFFFRFFIFDPYGGLLVSPKFVFSKFPFFPCPPGVQKSKRK